ncbi:MAG: homocysteine S-methyltransferase family protein [Rhizobiales bacterium]|nr:homocysteine S-methyltransferase family protein [Hyphomicrobiales bacterium]
MDSGVVLLDGGMGQELRKRRQDGDKTFWGTGVLIEAPHEVKEVHTDYINAGARVITTNTYALLRTRLDEWGLSQDKFPELMDRAGRLAVEARRETGGDVLIAGSLPPLNGSYLPDNVRPFDEIEPIYREHVALLAPHVDLFLCETMSTGAEGYAAAHAAQTSGKPVWVAWTLKDGGSSLLRSGETLNQAWAVLDGLSVEAVLANCCWPESISAAMKEMNGLGAPHAGGYANGFAGIPDNWTVKEKGVGVLGQRQEFGPDTYANHVADWIADGATIVGGCCEVGPAHIARLSAMLKEAA